jgi:2-desacetyl-2-hydroxyethyl bacteriochlorophyllide A dehydrogenase
MIELGATRDGGWQEELLVPAWAAIPLPESIPLSCGALIEPAANAVAAVVAGEVRRGDRVLVVGPGTIGLLVAQAVRVYRPASVSIAGLQRDSDRLALARRLGADEAVVVSGHRGFDAMPEPKRPFNVVIQCSDSTRATELAISAAARGGRIVLEGYTASGQSICMDPDQLVLEELTLRGVLGWTLSDFRSAIDLAGSGVFDFEPLITHRFGLSQYRQALQVAQSRESGAIKVVFTGANV